MSNYRSIGSVRFKNWHDALIQHGELDLQILGSALHPLADPFELSHLHERFIDAINWFGDAATDVEPAASVVKYTSAIERLFFGKFHPRTHKAKFASRITHVIGAYNCDDGRTHANAIKVYEARSELLHGDSSPRGKHIIGMAEIAEDLSRLCILCAARFYPMILNVYGNSGPDKLEEVMEKICTDGIDWLVQEASIAR